MARSTHIVYPAVLLLHSTGEKSSRILPFCEFPRHLRNARVAVRRGAVGFFLASRARSVIFEIHLYRIGEPDHWPSRPRSKGPFPVAAEPRAVLVDLAVARYAVRIDPHIRSPDSRIKLCSSFRERENSRRDNLRRQAMSIDKQSMGEQIRLKCSDCQAKQGYDVENCNELECPLWFFRFGVAHDAYIRRHGKEARGLFNPKNF
jgi:hypothetical protein